MGSGGAHVVVNTNFHILALFLLLLDETSRQTAAACIDNVAALLPLDRRVQTEVFATCEAKTSEFLFIPETLCSKLYEGLELDQCLFDLGHCAWRFWLARAGGGILIREVVAYGSSR